jgi:hypothetical protein
MRKLMASAAGILASAGLVLALGSAPAVAQESSHYGGLRSHCVGSKIDSHLIKNKRGKTVGHVELWYSSIKGGQNCVMTYNRAGNPWTRARIWRLKRKGGLADAAAGDMGFYQHYAGGSYVNNASGRCVTWGGSVGDFYWYSKPGGVHCG